MLTFPVQDQILTSILKRPSNLNCADCSTISPTWASLDFGVFICSNCSGAHRSLGPTITRVKSTKLDSWNQSWIQNMQIGNDVINLFWQAKLTSKKATSESSLDEVKRYVVDKYIRKKFASSGQDPLTCYKNGITQNSLQAVKNQLNKNNIKNDEIGKQQQKVRVDNKNKTQVKKQTFDLFTFEESKCFSQKQVQSKHQKVEDDDQFGDYTESTPTNQPQTTMSTTECLTFNDLLSISQNRIQIPQNTFVNPSYNMYHQPNHMPHNVNHMMINMPYLHKSQSQSHHNSYNMNMAPQYLVHNQSQHQNFISPQIRKENSSNSNFMWHK